MACYLNGEQFPRRAYEPDFSNNLYIREYLGLFRASNQLLTDCRIPIDRDAYINGLTIFGFNFSPDLSDGCGCNGYVSGVNHGTMRIEVHFKKKLHTTINVLVFAEFDNMIMIPEDRNAIVDYH